MWEFEKLSYAGMRTARKRNMVAGATALRRECAPRRTLFGIYLGKMFLQRQKGIQTDQIAKGNKDRKLYWTEVFMKIATYLVVLAEGISVIRNDSGLPVAFRWVGLATAFIGVMVFAVSVYTMRDSWRAVIPENDNTEFVTTGIYGWSRNPAFLGFDLTYMGLLLMFFNFILLVCTCFSMVMLHLQILQEEVFLVGVFQILYNFYTIHNYAYHHFFFFGIRFCNHNSKCHKSMIIN